MPVPPLDPPGTTKRPKRRGRIVLSLLAVLVLVGLAPLASVAWKLIDINREALTTSQQEYQLLLASTVAAELDIHVDGLRSELGRVARTLGSAAARGDDARRMLEDVIDARMVYLRYADLRGGTLDSGATALPSPIETHIQAGLGQAARMVAEGRDPAGLVATSSPILVEGQGPTTVLVLSAPVVSRGRFRGVLCAVVDLQSIWNEVILDHPSGNTVLAVDAQGRLFASSDPHAGPLGRDLSTTEIARRFLSAEGRARETFPFPWQEGGRTVRHLGSYEVTHAGWGILVHASERQVYTPVRSMVDSTLSWALAALGTAVLAAVLLAGRLSTPVNRLAAASRAFAAGDFSTRVEIASRNEIGELADTFNRMASEIEGYIRQLKHAAEENKDLFLGTIRALAQAIDAKDPYTRGHSVRVNKYSVVIARYLGLPPDQVRDIHVASLLHDVGKIGIDDAILKKAGPLTGEEFSVMTTHAALGEGIMMPIPRMKSILPGLRSHHERWNGSGYPDGLVAEAIPLMARIIAVADTFDAMTTRRPYQAARTYEAAVDKINELKGVGMDESVVEAFNRAFRAGEICGDEPRDSSVDPGPASAQLDPPADRGHAVAVSQ